MFKKLKILSRFKNAENVVTYEIRRANYFNKKIQLAGSDQRKILKVLNNFTLKLESNKLIKEISSNGTTISDSSEMANCFNIHLSETGNKLADKIIDAENNKKKCKN